MTENDSGPEAGGEKIASGVLALVAEDHPTNRKLIVAFLSKMGADVLEADDGQKAVAAVKENPAVDIIFMDIQMPVMDGLDAARSLRQGGYAGVIVAYTAESGDEDFKAYAAAGMNDLLRKPYKSDDLKKIILKWKSAFSENFPAEESSPAESGGEIDVWDADDFEDTVSGDYDLARELLSDFSAQTEKLLQKIPALIEAKDYTALRQVGHTLKGSAATISARSISFHGGALNKAAHEADDKKLDGERAVLLEELKKFNEAAGRWKKEKGFEDELSYSHDFL